MMPATFAQVLVGVIAVTAVLTEGSPPDPLSTPGMERRAFGLLVLDVSGVRPLDRRPGSDLQIHGGCCMAHRADITRTTRTRRGKHPQPDQAQPPDR
jgi:hypothetical protein